MKPLKICEIEEAVNGNITRGNSQLEINNVSTNSRTVKQGDLFIPLKGDKHDAHKFIPQVIAAGVGGIIVDKRVEHDCDATVIKVDDTNKALQDLAHYYRKKFADLKIVAITGSSGKTTTKDMIASILKKKYKILKTEGNLNNYFGLPLSLLKLEGDEDIAVLEMGMSELGEIKLLTEIAEPDIGVITNVGSTHLEFLKTVENVALGKSELVAGLSRDGIAILNYDNKYVREMERVFTGKKLLYYGLSEKADIKAKNIKMNNNDLTTGFAVNYRGANREIKIFKPGKHNVYNALAAICVACELEVDWSDIRRGLMSDNYSELRQEIKTVDNFVIINDTYNANPMSMKAALNVLNDIARGRTIAVLGAMLELGNHEIKAHKELGKVVSDRDIDVLITVGEQGKQIALGAKTTDNDSTIIYETDNNQQAINILCDFIKPGDTILVKGSRGNRMEEIVKEICRRGG